MQQLKIENVILIGGGGGGGRGGEGAGTNIRASQTSLAVQEVNFFFTKTQNIQLFATHKKLHTKQPVELFITVHCCEKSDLNFLISSFLRRDFTV